MSFNKITDIQVLMTTITQLKLRCEQLCETLNRGTDQTLMMHPDELENELMFIKNTYETCLSSAECINKELESELFIFADCESMVHICMFFDIAYKNYSRDDSPSLDDLCKWQKFFCSHIGDIISFCDFCLKHPYLNSLKNQSKGCYPFNHSHQNQPYIACVYAAPDMMSVSKKRCINCSHSLNENDMFCMNCGAEQDSGITKTIYSAPRRPKFK